MLITQPAVCMAVVINVKRAGVRWGSRGGSDGVAGISKSKESAGCAPAMKFGEKGVRKLGADGQTFQAVIITAQRTFFIMHDAKNAAAKLPEVAWLRNVHVGRFVTRFGYGWGLSLKAVAGPISRATRPICCRCFSSFRAV